MLGEVYKLSLSIRRNDCTAGYLDSLGAREIPGEQGCLRKRQMLQLISEHDHRLGFVMGTICLGGEPLRNTLRALTLPSIGALYLANCNRSQRISGSPNPLGNLHQSASSGSINAINLDRGDEGLEFCGDLIESVEHMFDYKTGV
ncbi:unannotated protein [freshwater metagenome]|uniref:Unannotated protein n=1 Tax=freshwater metagenome TaxID=449393 RepID=A0A6J6YKY0_9ZZZZ